MTAEEFILERLLSVAGITDVVGDRAAPHPAPYTTDYPLITYQRTSTPPEHDLSGAAGILAPRFYINAWARDFRSASDLAELIRDAFDGYSDRDNGFQSVQVVNDFNDFDDDELVWRRAIEVVIWHDN